MPELPEVETTARLIRPQLLGRRIEGVRVAWERSLGGDSRAAFGRRVRGARVAAVGRRGKYVLLDLQRAGQPAGTLLVHLRMSGRLVVERPQAPAGPYARVRLLLDGGRELRFLDVRKFGRFVFHDDPAPVLERLGPEPLGPAFTRTWLRAALRIRRRQLKPLLLDQSFLAGLGNIYVDESLFRARIHPLRSAHRLDGRAVGALHAAIRDVLAAALAAEGSSIDAFYRTPEGRAGAYQERFCVYGRAGQPCPRCGASVRRLVVGQRGTHVCARCQRPPRGP